MKGFSIKFQILLVVMIPVLLIDIFLTTVHVNSSIDQAQELLQSKGETVAKQIASASEFYLFTGNHQQIQKMLDASVNTNNIIYSAVYSAQGELIASTEGESYLAQNSPHYYYFRYPIQSQTIVRGDVFETQIDTPTLQTDTLGWIHMYLSRQSLQQAKIDIFSEALVLFLAMLAVAVALTAIISKRITRPVFVLLDHLKRVEHGELGQVIKNINANEIGDVQKGFNSMSQSLLANRMELNDKIQTATEELMLAISDLEEKNLQLGEARDAAQEANRVKSRFLANISHEIRTPINGINGFVNLLKETGLDTDQKRYADIIRQSTRDLSAIINEVLDFSKIESGKVEIVEEAFNLSQVLESTRNSLYTVSMEKGIDLHLTLYSDTPIHLVGDQFRLKQILINLIGNAIKFTDQGFVSITVLVQDESEFETSIQFKVEDSGIGISEQDQARLFQAFSQIDSSTNRRYSGTGLGLVISRNLARLMGGDIEMNSELGSGSVFTLTLPFRPADNIELQPGIFDNQNALIYAFNSRCVNELQSLYNCMGFATQTQLLDDNENLQPLRDQLTQNLPYLDLIVFDLRHSTIHPDQLFDMEQLESSRVVVMHYDINLIDHNAYGRYQFIPIINNTEHISHSLLADEQKVDVHQAVDHASAKSPSVRKVLMVDDNEVNLALASELTKLWGHLAFAASNAEEAMNLFEQQEYDLILLDIQMPEIDGVELMQMMRNHQPQMQTPIVAITANIHEDEKERLLKLGFDAFLGKPLEEGKLKRLLEHDVEPVVTVQRSDQSEIAEQPDQEEPISIDFEFSLKLSGNNEQLCLDMLKMLHEGIEDYRQQLRNAIDIRSLGKLAYLVHKLQGITCYTGLPRLKQLLARYDALKHIDTEQTMQVCEEVILELSRIDQLLEESLKHSSAEICAGKMAGSA